MPEDGIVHLPKTFRRPLEDRLSAESSQAAVSRQATLIEASSGRVPNLRNAAMCVGTLAKISHVCSGSKLQVSNATEGRE